MARLTPWVAVFVALQRNLVKAVRSLLEEEQTFVSPERMLMWTTHSPQKNRWSHAALEIFEGRRSVRRSSSLLQQTHELSPGRTTAPSRLWMTVEQAAEWLQVHPQTVYQAVRTGEMPAVRVGRSWRIDPDRIKRRAAEQTQHRAQGQTRQVGAGPASPPGQRRVS